MTFRLFGNEVAIGDYFTLLRWMIFTEVTLFGFAFAQSYGLFQLMAAQDRSRLSILICILYAAISVHCLASIVGISREIKTAHRVRERVTIGVHAYRVDGSRVVVDPREGAILRP